VFIAGTQPVTICHLHGNGRTQVAGWEPVQAQPALDAKPEVAQAQPTSRAKTPRSIPVTPETPQEEQPAPHKGFFGKLRDLFK
jgi:hypothetical protein